LKTYLPESDIDITILFKGAFLKGHSLDTPSKVGYKELSLLKESLESHSEEYKIKDISIINASVKIIKMQCDGIPIDISFNQIGGILSFKYLEEVDKEIGKDHLFKKAILILKAWCMYKGRVLGSNIGCFSSYTLEVLIVHLILTHDIKTPIISTSLILLTPQIILVNLSVNSTVGELLEFY